MKKAAKGQRTSFRNKYLALIISMLLFLSASAQFDTTRIFSSVNGDGFIWKGGRFTNVLRAPQYLPILARKDSGAIAWHNNILWVFTNEGVWDTLRGTGGSGGSSGVDTTHLWFPLYAPNESTIAIYHDDGLLPGTGIVTYSGTGLKYYVSPSFYYINHKLYTDGFDSVTLSPADPTNPRSDIIAVDTTGHVVVLTGTPATSPLDPQINYGSQLPLTKGLFLPPSATTPSGITTKIIYNEHTGGEATISTSGTITANPDNTDVPYNGTKDLYVSSYTNNSKLIATDSGPDTIQAGSVLTGALYLVGAISNTITVQLYNSTTPVSNALALNSYINRNDSDVYQPFAIPLSDFTLSGTVYNKYVFTHVGTDNSGAKGYYIDYLRLQNGLGNVGTKRYVDSTKIIAGNEYYYINGFPYLAGAVGGAGGGVSGITKLGTSPYGLNKSNDSTYYADSSLLLTKLRAASLYQPLGSYLTTVDTTNIANFSVKVRSLFNATSPIVYNNGKISFDTTIIHTSAYNNGTYLTTETDPVVKAINGIVKSNGTTIAAAIPTTDYSVNYVRTTVKTANYTAAVNDLVPVNTTSGNITITLPTAPIDKARIAIKYIIQGSVNTVTIAAGGSDVFNKIGGGSTLSLVLVNQGVGLQYDAANAIWTVLYDDLPLSQLDVRYTSSTDPWAAYPVRGTIFSEPWANTTNWAVSGAAPTTSVSGGYLSISDPSGSNAFNRYIAYSAYGPTDIKPIKITSTIVVGTMSSTSYCPRIGLWGGNTMVVNIDLTTGANSGKISWYYDSSTTPAKTSTSALVITSGDTLDFTFELRKEQYYVTYKDRNTLKGQSITDMFYSSSYFNRPYPPAIKYYAIIQATGTTTHKIGPFIFSSDAPKNATICEVGNSLTNGTAISNLDNNTMGLLSRSCKGVFYAYASPGNKVEDINAFDILSLTPQIVVMRMGVNNVNTGQTPTQFMSNMRAFVNIMVAGGYPLGTKLFVATILPESLHDVTPYNDSLVAYYGSTGAIIDLNKTLRGSTGTALNPIYYALDGLHLSDFADLALANTYINFFNLVKQPYYTTQQYISPTTDGKLNLGRINAWDYSYITMADPSGDVAIKNDTLRKSGFHLIAAGPSVGKIGTGISYDGTNFINEASNAALWGATGGAFSYLSKTGQTVGSVSTIGGADCKFNIDTLGNVGIEKNSSDVLKYPLEVISGTNTAVNVHTLSSTEDGLYLTPTSTGFHISQGGAIVAGNWTAKATTFTSIAPNSGVIRFFINTGLTNGSTFSPTVVDNFSITGLRIGSSTAAVDKLDVEGNLSLVNAGNKIKIATGTNASVGVSGAMTAGTITISTTAVTASSRIFLTYATVAGTQGFLSVGTITAGTSFVINSSSATDTSTINWWIVN